MGVGVIVGVGVTLGVSVDVGDAVVVGVNVTVAVEVAVAVDVGVGVGVAKNGSGVSQPLNRNNASTNGANTHRAYELRTSASRKNLLPNPAMHAILSDPPAGINGTLDL